MMNTNPCTINPNFELDLINKPLLTRKRGEELVEKLVELNKDWAILESKCEYVNIDLHQATGMNKSFFLGAFSLRVKALGADIFRKRYKFINNDVIKEKIESTYISAALLELPRD